MTKIRVAAAALNQTPLDWKNNQANIIAAIEEARRSAVQILCLPEMAVTGYGHEEARVRSEEAGFDRHLVKPVYPDALFELLAEIGAEANRQA